MRKRIQKPIKEVTLPKEHFAKVLERARKNEEFWKKLSSISDDELIEVDTVNDSY